MTSWREAQQRGFSLIEALVSMALMGMALAGLSMITAQWLPKWSYGIGRVQNDEILDRAIERLVADLSSAQNVPLNGQSVGPLFVGAESSVLFVRGSVGPNVRPGLEVVRLVQQGVTGLIRTRARYAPALQLRDLPPLHDPVALLAAPLHVQFSYAGQDRIWKTSWTDAKDLPRSVRILVTDDRTAEILPASTVALLHVDGESDCESSAGSSTCGSASSPPPATVNQTASQADR